MERKPLGKRVYNVPPNVEDELEGAACGKVVKLDSTTASSDQQDNWPARFQRLRIFGGISNKSVNNVHMKLNEECTMFQEDHDLNLRDDMILESISKYHSLCPTEKGFLVTGGSGSLSLHYDIKTEKWEKLPDLRITRFSHISFAIGKVYFVAGGNTYTNSFRSSQDMTFEHLNTSEQEAEWKLLASEGTEGKCLPEEFKSSTEINIIDNIRPSVCVVGEEAYIFDHLSYTLLQFSNYQVTLLNKPPVPFVKPVYDFAPVNYNDHLTVMAALGKTLYIGNTTGLYQFCIESKMWSDSRGPGLQYRHFQSAVLSLQEQNTIVVLGGKYNSGYPLLSKENWSDKVERWSPGDTAWTDCNFSAPWDLHDFIAYMLPEE